MLAQPKKAVSSIRYTFIEQSKPMTLTELKDKLPYLKSSEISMALCYLLKQRYVTRQKIENPIKNHRKTVYIYTYSAEKLSTSIAGVNNAN